MGRAGFIRRVMTVLLLQGGIAIGHSAQGQFVTLEGRKFMLNGQEFYPVVMNYSTELASNSNNSQDPVNLYCTPATHYDYSIYSHLECDDVVSCTAQLATHFDKIASMGFNTIRLGMCPVMHQNGTGGLRQYRMTVRYNDGNWPAPYLVDMLLDSFDDPFSERYFELLRSVIQIADAHGLKVILLCAEDSGPDPPEDQLTLALDQAAVDLYASYLSKLASELSQEPGLLAYDLWNEPNWTADHLTAYSKNEICGFTTEWYDSIHGADPNHFVTLGGSAYHEISSWDPALMKLDFYSPHIYPNPERFDDYNNANANERYKAELYWLAADCPMPWLIGETGFIAEDDVIDPLDAVGGYNEQHLDADPAHHRMPWMGGSEQDQRDFAELSLNAVRAYGATGYSWWDFQNSRVSWLMVTDPKDFLQGNFFGLLKYGNDAGLGLPSPWNVQNSWRDKLAVQSFSAFDPGSAPTALPPPPTNYYSWHGTGGPIERQYTLVDENTQEPIANALATVVWFYHDQLEQDIEVGEDLWDRNPTNESGLAVIRKPPDTWTGYDPPVAKDLRLQVSGGGGIQYGNTLPTSGTFPLNRHRLFFSDHQQDIIVPTADYRDLKAWSELSVTDMLVEGNGSAGGSANLHARDLVNVSSEFHAQRGSEVHLYTDATFMECGADFHSPQPRPVQYPQLARTAENTTFIQLRFQGGQPVLSLSPNPCGEEVMVVCTWDVWTCRVVDAQGREVFVRTVKAEPLQIGTRSFAAGEYTVIAEHNGESITSKLVKNP